MPIELDRRGPIRHPASGAVWIQVNNEQIVGRLLDRSSDGFRIACPGGELVPGLEVDFVIGHQQGRARVAWNRFTNQQWETGLVILRL